MRLYFGICCGFGVESYGCLLFFDVLIFFFLKWSIGDDYVCIREVEEVVVDCDGDDSVVGIELW